MITEIVHIIPMKFCQSLKYSSSVLCLPEARLLQFRDATISTAEATTVACSLYPLASRKTLTSSSEWMASLKLIIFGGGGSKPKDTSLGSSSSKECWSEVIDVKIPLPNFHHLLRSM